MVECTVLRRVVIFELQTRLRAGKPKRELSAHFIHWVTVVYGGCGEVGCRLAAINPSFYVRHE